MYRMENCELQHLRKESHHQSDIRIENAYDEITYEKDVDPVNERRFVGSAVYLAKKDKKSKLLGLFGCFGKGRKSVYWTNGSSEKTWPNGPLETVLYVTSGNIPGAASTGCFVNKGVQTERGQYQTTDQETQIPDIDLVCSNKTKSSQSEGAIRLSLPNSKSEDLLLETFIRNRDAVANVFEKYGLELKSIEKGSIRFKFTIREDVSALSEDKMRNLLRNICLETLQSIPGTLGLEDVVIEVELTSLQSTTYNINATVVQLGNDNKVNMLPPARCEPARPSMYLNPFHSGTATEAEAVGLPLLAETQSGDQELRKQSVSGSPAPCKQTQDDSAYGSGCAQGDQDVRKDPISRNSTPCKQTEDDSTYTPHIESGDQEVRKELISEIPTPCKQTRDDSTYTPLIESGNQEVRKEAISGSPTPCKQTRDDSAYNSGCAQEVFLRARPDAHIIFKAQDAKTMKLVMAELRDLKFLSCLEFDLESDATSYTVKMCIFKQCTTSKDFFTSVVLFLTYRHLLSAITTSMIEVTVEVPSADPKLSHYVNTMQRTHDATINFQAPDQTGMDAIMAELESLKSISLLKFDVQSHSPTNNVTMAVQRNSVSDEIFISSVLQFLTYNHLMKAMFDNEVDVKIKMYTKTHDTVSITTTSDDSADSEVVEAKDEYADPEKTKPTHKRSGLRRFFSSMRKSLPAGSRRGK